ncbi:hypothetical protein [Neisseria animalis]|nr:hypothetical protein [Neisseria animalis]VEE06360.1 Uncharacterised protein [Neisseria animalis]
MFLQSSFFANQKLRHPLGNQLFTVLFDEPISDGILQPVLTDTHHSEPLSLNLLYPHRTLLAPRVKFVMDYFRKKLAEDGRLQALPLI